MAEKKCNVSTGGISLGFIVAAYLSWATWHNLGWAVINGLFGWFYVIYWLIRYWE